MLLGPCASFVKSLRFSSPNTRVGLRVGRALCKTGGTILNIGSAHNQVSHGSDARRKPQQVAFMHHGNGV